MSNTLRHRSGIAPLQRSARTRYTRPCEHCGTLVETTPYRAKQGWDKYCDRACFSAARLAKQEHKVCTVCGLDKPASEYACNRQQPKRLRPECRKCSNNQARRWRREQHPDDLLARFLARQFGLTLSQFEHLLQEQGGVCAICGTATPGSNFPRFAVDHDHETGYVRGLLCSACNAGLGAFADDPARLQAALGYLACSPAQRAGIIARHTTPSRPNVPVSGPCPFCDRTFQDLRRHVVRKHREEQAS